MEEVKVLQKAGEISFNFDEIKAGVENIAKAYEGATFHEDTVKDAKKESATLKKIKKAINDKRIEVKKECLKPYLEFEVRVKEITAIIDKPVNEITLQIQTFEENKINEKRKEIEVIYNEFLPEIKEVYPLDEMLNPKWKNATLLLRDIKAELEESAEATLKDLNVIKSQKSDVEEKAISIYSRQRNLAEALQLITDDRVRKEQILADQKILDEKAKEDEIRKSERQAQVIETEHKQELEKVSTEVIESLTPIAEEVEEIYNYNITLGVDAKRKLELFMNSVGIEFELQESFL